MAKKDYYQILGVEHDATDEQIRRAYRHLAKEYHPDRNKGSKQAEEKFKEINEAHTVLSDKEKRAKYDLMGDASAQFGEGDMVWNTIFSRTAGQPGAERRGRGFNSYEDLGDLGDLFSQVFAGASRFGTGAGYEEPSRGQDIITRVEVPLELSVKGGRVRVTVAIEETCASCGGSGAGPGGSRPCPSCGGTGMVQTAMGGFAVSRPCPKCLGRGQVITMPCADCRAAGRVRRRRSFMVNIPPGVRPGQRIRLSGQGHPGSPGAPPGDLYVEVHVAEHDRFRREGNDVYSEITINVVQAALGTEVSAETVQGAFKVKVPAGTNSGAKVRLRGKGVQSADGSAGDHYVVIKVATPQHLSGEQKKLLEQFAASAGLER